MNLTDEKELINCFIDAGCNKEQIEIVKENLLNREKLTEILVEQRKTILIKIHKDEDKMKCIDYLIHELKKEK